MLGNSHIKEKLGVAWSRQALLHDCYLTRGPWQDNFYDKVSISAQLSHWGLGFISQRANEFIIEILWKLLFALIMILMVQSGHQFALVTTDELSWYVQIRDVPFMSQVKAIWIIISQVGATWIFFARFGSLAHEFFVKWVLHHTYVHQWTKSS